MNKIKMMLNQNSKYCLSFTSDKISTQPRPTPT